MPTIYDTRTSIRFLDMALAWGLKCPIQWSRLRELYVRVVKDADGNPRTVPIDIPDFPPGNGGAWCRTIFAIWSWYKAALSEARTPGDDDRWESFATSYLAMRRCVEVGGHEDLNLVFTACKRAHEDLLDRERVRAHPALDDVNEPAFDPDDVDLRLDLDEALARLPERDAVIARMRLFEDQEFKEIAALVGLDERTVRRRYGEVLPAIRARLADYLPVEPTRERRVFVPRGTTLSAKDVLGMRRLHEAGVSQVGIARRFGVSPAKVSKVVRSLIYRSVADDERDAA